MNQIPLKYIVLIGILVVVTIFFIMKNAIAFHFHSTRDEFLNWYFAQYPTTATWIGIHDYDGMLQNTSQTNREQKLNFLDQTKIELLKLDDGSFNEIDRIDYRILLDKIDYMIFELRELKSFSWDPLEYIQELGYGYESLLVYEFAPVEQRAENLSRRFLATSEYLAQAKENLLEFPQPHLSTAISQAKGVLSLFDSAIPEMAKALHDEAQQDFYQNAGIAKQTILEFIAYLESHLFDEQFRDFRLGSDLYYKKLYYTLQEDIEAPEILAKAERQLNSIQNEMFVLAEPLFKQWFGEQTLLKSHENQLKITRRVLDKIADEHSTRDQFVNSAKTTIKELEQFIKEKNLLTLDDSKPLEIRETPEYQRGISGASLQSPGPLESRLPTFYNVSPLPDEWSEEQDKSFLKEYNDISMKILSIHEALPGHYVQQYYANRHPSLVRAVFGSGVMIEGWAHYAENMMVENGFGDNDPRYALVEMKWKLRGIANAIIDQKIHAGQITKEEALKLMIDETFQEVSEAEGKWKRAQLTSAQLSTYFTGYYLFKELLEDYKKQKGDNFNIKTFHEQLLSYGSIPIKYIREMMLE